MTFQFSVGHFHESMAALFTLCQCDLWKPIPAQQPWLIGRGNTQKLVNYYYYYYCNYYYCCYCYYYSYYYYYYNNYYYYYYY